jgi:hypothetical protein
MEGQDVRASASGMSANLARRSRVRHDEREALPPEQRDELRRAKGLVTYFDGVTEWAKCRTAQSRTTHAPVVSCREFRGGVRVPGKETAAL